MPTSDTNYPLGPLFINNYLNLKNILRNDSFLLTICVVDIVFEPEMLFLPVFSYGSEFLMPSLIYLNEEFKIFFV